jgi:hypothetical protein
MPAGRPSGYNETITAEIAERLSNGEPMKKICRDEHMPHYVTVLKWQRAHPEFSDLTARAKAEGTHALADECIEIADDKTIDPQHKRFMIDTRIRLIGKWNSKAYGEKVEMAATGHIAVSHTLDISNLSSDELDVLEKALGGA